MPTADLYTFRPVTADELPMLLDLARREREERPRADARPGPARRPARPRG